MMLSDLTSMKLCKNRGRQWEQTTLCTLNHRQQIRFFQYCSLDRFWISLLWDSLGLEWHQKNNRDDLVYEVFTTGSGSDFRFTW